MFPNIPTVGDLLNSNVGSIPAPNAAGMVQALFSQLQAISGPIVTQGYSSIRSNFLKFNDIAVARSLQYRLNYTSTFVNPAKPLLYGPVRMSAGQLLSLFNQLPWHLYDNNPGQRHGLWRELQEQLRYLGIDIEVPDNLQMFNPARSDWQRMIEFGSTAAPLVQVIHDYYRGIGLPEESRAISTDELNFHLQRAGLRRQVDRQRMLAPFFHWNALDVLKLQQASQATPQEIDGMFSAAGFANQRDRELLGAISDPLEISTIVAMLLRGSINVDQARIRLAAAGAVNRERQDAILNFRFKPGNASILVVAAARRAWDDQLAEKWGLDDGLAESPAARWWIEAQGVSAPGAELPGANGNPADWLKLEWRTSRPLIDFARARELQFRLRPLADGTGNSVVPDAPAWGAIDTREMLKMHGYSEPIIEHLMGVIHEPLNIRLINHILGPYSTHPEVRKAADEAFGVGVNWIEMAMLDHGFSPAYARVAAVGVQAQADDRDNAELKEHEKTTRAIQRKVALDRYRIGTQTFEQSLADMIGPQFPSRLAADQLTAVAAEFNLQIVERQIKSLHEAYMTGKMSSNDAAAIMKDIGITPDRVAIYLKEWLWERTEKQQILSTEAVLAALKAGFMTPDVAAARLVNLGWQNSEALLKVAMVERDLQIAQAKTASAAATKAMSEANRLHAKTMAEEKARATEALKAEKETRKVQREAALAAHEKLLAQSKYYASVHASNSAYATADKKGDEQKKLAEIEKQVAAYHQYLIEQLDLVFQGPSVAAQVLPLETIPQPFVVESKGNGTSDSKTAPTDGGTGNGAGQSSAPS